MIAMIQITTTAVTGHIYCDIIAIYIALTISIAPYYLISFKCQILLLLLFAITVVQWISGS